MYFMDFIFVSLGDWFTYPNFLEYVGNHPYRGLVVRAAATLVYKPDVELNFSLFHDSNQVPKWFAIHYNLEILL